MMYVTRGATTVTLVTVATVFATAAVFMAVGMYDVPFQAYAYQNSNENLLVSAESVEFDNHFAGSMVIEVVVAEPGLLDTDGGAGEPRVSINGETLRMAQARNGYWYGYFANLDAARDADQLSLDAGVPGEGLDFGVFCSATTPAGVLGASFSDADGVAVPRSGGLTGFTDGTAPLSVCGGNVEAQSPEINNILRSPPSINKNGAMAAGQIGLDSDAWPIIQLYSFSGSVRIQYDRAGGSQQVMLQYDDIPAISHRLDRGETPYPARAEVILYVHDPQLNQDPTDEDSWTFGTTGRPTVFYQAFHDGGRPAANGGAGLDDLYPHLSRLGFDDNGYLSIDPGRILLLKPNKNQPTEYVTDGRDKFGGLVTLVESRPNSGIFESVDSLSTSNLQIASDAGRGLTAVIEYNDRSLSVLTGYFTASLSLEKPSLTVDSEEGWRSGSRIPITLHDRDQNTSPNTTDDLDVFKDSAKIPTIRIGSPMTVAGASNVILYPSSGVFEGGIPIHSRVPDPISARLYVDVQSVPRASPAAYGMMSIDLGFSAFELFDMLVDDQSIPGSLGTSWVNVDLRSLAHVMGASGLKDAELSLHFGAVPDPDPVMVAGRGTLASMPNMLRILSDDIDRISAKSGPVHAVVDLGVPNGKGMVVRGEDASELPVVIDFFSFGSKGDKTINNAVYRLELEEESADSGSFGGTLEYAAANPVNMLDPEFVEGITAIGNDVKFIVMDEMTDEDGITINYSDLASVGVIITSSSQTDIQTRGGVVSFSTPSGQLRFGVPVTVTLNDPDLNTSADTLDVYHVVDDPHLPSVDTVGQGSYTLLEIKFKDIRYKRCMIDGAVHGGLASTGFTLVETGPGTGVFEGVFKMPVQICDESGTRLISTAGGSMDVVYYDSHDASGNPNTYSLLRSQEAMTFAGDTGRISEPEGVVQSPPVPTVRTVPPQPEPPELDLRRVVLKSMNDTGRITMSGNVGEYVPGVPVSTTITYPDNAVQEFDLFVNTDGGYGSLLMLEGGTALSGKHDVHLSYGERDLGTVSFYVESDLLVIPSWMKDAAQRWSAGVLTNTEFAESLKRMTDAGIIVPSGAMSGVVGLMAGDPNAPVTAPDLGAAQTTTGVGVTVVPAWLKDVAAWWTADLISDKEFVMVVQHLVDSGILGF